MPSGGHPLRILLTTEGTYPFVVGGVSTWCDQILRGLPEFDWSVAAITGPAVALPSFVLPPHARLATHVRLWDPAPARPARSRRWPGRSPLGATPQPALAARLVRALLGWAGDPHDLVSAFVWCRQNPGAVLASFQHRSAWPAYLDALRAVLAEDHVETTPAPDFDLHRAVEFYQLLRWLAHTAAAPMPPVDLSHVTAAGWAAVPALVNKALYGTPLLLTEHGLYVREAYLAAVRNDPSPAARFMSTRLARALTLATYRAADLVCPVTAAHSHWEAGLGVAASRIHPIPNGVTVPDAVEPAPRTRTVVSVGRLDPLKDILTMLRVAASVVHRVPDATFLHYGPVPEGGEGYAERCYRLHEELGLGERFRFMGGTKDPHGVVRQADVVILTSISEGLPLSVLEALAQQRPVVATAVGGVLDALQSAGLIAAPGDVEALASGVATLLEQPDLAEQLGRRGRERTRRLYQEQRCIDGYRDVLMLLGEGRLPRHEAA